jgi:hypothetical protein
MEVKKMKTFCALFDYSNRYYDLIVAFEDKPTVKELTEFLLGYMPVNTVIKVEDIEQMLNEGGVSIKSNVGIYTDFVLGEVEFGKPFEEQVRDK